MGLQYDAVPPQSGTFTGSTKAAIINGIETILLAAGWTEISATAGVDILFQSVTTPQGNQIRVRVFDDSSSSVRIRLSNVSGTLVQSDSCYLFPQTSKVFRIVANRYQFACWVPTSVAARDFVICSALYIPGFLNGGSPPLITSAFIMGNANSTSDTTIRGSFRTILCGRDYTTGLCNGFGILNATSVEWAGGTASPFRGAPSLSIPQSADMYYVGGNLWHDGSCLIPEPLVGWGSSLSAPNLVRGQLWDAMVSTDSFPMDDTTVFDSHNWVNLTSSNTGADSLTMAGSLWIVTP